MSDLAHCKKCGFSAPPEPRKTAETSHYWNHAYRCTRCLFQSEGGKTWDEAAREWNRRAPSPPPDNLVERATEWVVRIEKTDPKPWLSDQDAMRAWLIEQTTTLLQTIQDGQIEADAKIAEAYPERVLVMWDRPGGPPGNGYRQSTFFDIGAAIRAQGGGKP